MIAEVNGLFKNKIVKNASWIIACKIFQMILNLIVGMLTARYLGPSNYGVVNYAASVVAFMIPVVNLGLTNVMVQELVNNPDKEGEILGTSMSFSFASAVLSVLGVICFACIANRGEKETILVCAFYSLSLLFRAFEMVIYWFQSKLMSKYTSIIMLVAYFVVALYRIFLLANHMSIYWFALSQTIDVMLISVISIIVYKIKGGEKFGFSLELGKRLLKKSHYYIVSGLMVTIFAQTDKIMLKVLISSEDTGYYSAAVTCAGMSSFVFSAIIDSMRPSIFARKKESEEKFEERLISLYTIIIYISLLQCVVMTLLSRFIILFLY
jgi:O-antigen/teichoic acid export membrane protein